MTVNTANPHKKIYTGDDVSINFTYDWRITAASELRVVLSDTGVETEQVLSTDYTVTGIGDDTGGNVVFGIAPASGVKVFIFDNPPSTQLSDFVENDDLPASVLEEGLDKLTRITKSVEEKADRAVTLPADSLLTDIVIPESQGNRETIVWNVAGDKLELDDNPGVSADQAAASASAAASSASASAASASAAATSETNAANSASEAAASAASNNIETPTSDDAGKIIIVNDTEDGFDISNLFLIDEGNSSIAINGTLDASATTNGIILPEGTTAQRPSTPTGPIIRHNSDREQVETYNQTQSQWDALNNWVFIEEKNLPSETGNGGNLYFESPYIQDFHELEFKFFQINSTADTGYAFRLGFGDPVVYETSNFYDYCRSSTYGDNTNETGDAGNRDQSIWQINVNGTIDANIGRGMSGRMTIWNNALFSQIANAYQTFRSEVTYIGSANPSKVHMDTAAGILRGNDTPITGIQMFGTQVGDFDNGYIQLWGRKLQ